MNAKELSRKVVEGIDIEKIKFADDDERNKLTNNLMDCAYELYKETKEICEVQKKPLYSAMKQVYDKSKSIAARVDKLLNADPSEMIVNPDFYILSMYSRYYDNDGVRYLGSIVDDFDREFISLIKSRYNEIVNRFEKDVKHAEKVEKTLENFSPHVCLPLENFIGNNSKLNFELLECFMALGQYHTLGFTTTMLRPLIRRTNFLKYCSKIGGVTKELIEEFEKDEEAFLLSEKVRNVIGF